jgi:plastocyanin
MTQPTLFAGFPTNRPSIQHGRCSAAGDRSRIAVFAAACTVACMLACTQGGRAPESPALHYTPQSRNVTITTVPLLVKEQQHVYPFLKVDFAKGGILEGKEVYAFSPSTVTVVQGDTIHFTFINPEDDVHSFLLPDFAVSLPAQKTTTATYVAKRAGIFPFVCAIQAHLPMMSGQLVVLSAASMSAR